MFVLCYGSRFFSWDKLTSISKSVYLISDAACKFVNDVFYVTVVGCCFSVSLWKELFLISRSVYDYI